MIRRWWRDRRAELLRVRQEARHDLHEAQVEGLTAERDELRRQVTQLQGALASSQSMVWMLGTLLQRQRSTSDAHTQYQRQRAIADHPTSVYATQPIRRQE